MLFLDSDDCYEPTFIERLVTAVEECSVDISMCRFWISDIAQKQKEKKASYTRTSGKIEKSFFPNLYAFHKHYQFSWCCCCYKKNIITDNSIKFDQDLKYGEDFKFLATYMFHCKDGYFLDEYLYQYNMNRNSVTHNLSYRIVDNIEAQKYVVELWGQDASLKSNLLQFILYRAIMSVAVKMTDVSHEAFYKYIHQYPVKAAMKYITCHGETSEARLVAILYCISPNLFEKVVCKMRRI